MMSDFKYSTITVSGTDAFDFLQAQLATDLSNLTDRIDGSDKSEATVHRSAWCNPKGRVICTPVVEPAQHDFALTIPADLGELVMQRLTLFRFRSRVEFELSAGPTTTTEDELLKIQTGVPEIALAQSEKFTPHMLNLDLLQMVSVEKGCYPGQEIIARTHFRGASKRRCLRFMCDAPIQPGASVTDGDRNVGEVVNALGGELLAVVPLAAADSSLFVDQHALTRLALPYTF